jgi:hypothetical protein
VCQGGEFWVLAPMKGMGRKQRIARSTSHAVDWAIAEIADSQHGNITREQLVGLGLSRDQIDRRVRAGRLPLVHRGVYSVGRPPKTAQEHAHAAVLACGEGAALSHRSALALWGLGEWRWSAIHVAVTGDRRPKGIKVHRSSGLTGRDIRTHAGIRMTSPARTILDCARTLTDKQLNRAVNDGRRSPQAHLRAWHLSDIIGRFPSHPGAKKPRRFTEVEGGPARSDWEDAFPAWCAEHGLPPPVMGAIVAGHEVDALFPAEKVIVELDSWEFHQDRGSFESDRDRDADALAAGHVTVRITWGRMTAGEAERLHRILEQRRL